MTPVVHALIDGILNTVLFVLIGLEVVRVDFSIGIFASALLTIAITLAARAISVAAPLNLIGTVLELPRGSWQLLTWAGLRGGVSVALALCITFDARTVFQQHRPRWASSAYWVIETVAAELGPWLRANPGLSVSINVPPEILGRGGIRYAADKAGLSDLFPQLILEITERGVPDLIGLRALDDYVNSGIRVAIDDVCRVAGANLALSSRAPLSVVKIDASLIAQIDPRAPAPDWLDGVSALILSAGLMVIAEGVETEPQALATRRAGIQAAQGYYFSRPLSAQALKDFCRAPRPPWAPPAVA